MLILVKHSLPEIDLNRLAADWPLPAIGRERCGWLADRLRKYRPERLIASDERKAIETAEEVAARLGLSFTTDAALREHDRAGVPWHGEDEWQRLIAEFFRCPNELMFGNETAAQALGRFADAVDRIMQSCGQATTVVVAHGTVISLYAAARTGVDGYSIWRRLGLPSFIVVQMEKPEIVAIESFNGAEGQD
jgi:broad specificity phosphatase PhoE